MSQSPAQAVFSDYPFLETVLDSQKIDKLVCGEVKGADTLASKYAELNSIPVEKVLPDYPTHEKMVIILPEKNEGSCC